MGPGVNVSPEWWRRSSIFCMAVHDGLCLWEWAITPVYNRGVGSWWRGGVVGVCILAQSWPWLTQAGLWCDVWRGCSVLDLQLIRDHGLSARGWAATFWSHRGTLSSLPLQCPQIRAEICQSNAISLKTTFFWHAVLPRCRCFTPGCGSI